jgi:hypothetical protein
MVRGGVVGCSYWLVDHKKGGIRKEEEEEKRKKEGKERKKERKKGMIGKDEYWCSLGGGVWGFGLNGV